MKEVWSTQTNRRNWNKRTQIDFNDWVKEKAEGHKQKKMSSGKGNLDDNCTSNGTRKEKGTKSLASAAEFSQQRNPANKNKTLFTTTSIFVVYKAKDLLWKCAAFQDKTPSENPQTVAAHKLCFSYFHGQDFFQTMPKTL